MKESKPQIVVVSGTESLRELEELERLEKLGLVKLKWVSLPSNKMEDK